MPVPSVSVTSVAAGDDAVRLPPPVFAGPLAALLRDLRHLLREAVLVLLRRQVVERAVVLPAEHLGALHLADDLVAVLAGLLLEELLDGLEVRHAVEPVARSSSLRSLTLPARRSSSPLDSMRFSLNAPLAT